jgi:hypothetical protein
VYAVTSTVLTVEAVPLVVQTKTGFTVLAYGVTPSVGARMTLGIPGSSPSCMVDGAEQCWKTVKVYKTGVWKAIATIGKLSASSRFYAPLVRVPLQVQHGTKMVTTISSAPPGCSISESVGGKIYTAKASGSGTATLRVMLSTIGVLSVTVTIDGTRFTPYSVDVT